MNHGEVARYVVMPLLVLLPRPIDIVPKLNAKPGRSNYVAHKLSILIRHGNDRVLFAVLHAKAGMNAIRCPEVGFFNWVIFVSLQHVRQEPLL